MTEIEKHESTVGRPWWRAGIVVIALVFVALVAVWFLLTELAPFLTLRLVGYVTEAIVNTTGASRNLVRGVLVIAAFPFCWAVGEVLRLPVPWGNQKRSPRTAKIILTLYTSAYFLAIFALGRSNVSTKDGTLTKWYCSATGELHYFDEPGYCPQHGLKLDQVTPEIAIAEIRRREGMGPQLVPCQADTQRPAFDPLTGKPRLWFGKSATGEVQCFDGEGFHPTTSVQLEPVTPEFLQKTVELDRLRMQKLAEEEETRAKQEAAVAASERRSEEARRATVAAAAFREKYTYRGAVEALPSAALILAVNDSQFSSMLAEKFITEPRQGILKPAAFGAEVLAPLAAGDPRILTRLGLAHRTGMLLVGRLDLSTPTPSSARADLLEVQGHLVLHRVSLQGRNSKTLDIHEKGVGFDASLARENCYRILIEALQRKPAINDLIQEESL